MMCVLLEPLQGSKLYLTAMGQEAELLWVLWGSIIETGTCTIVGGAGKWSLEGEWRGSNEEPVTDLLKQVTVDKSGLTGVPWSQVCPTTKVRANPRPWRGSL